MNVTDSVANLDLRAFVNNLDRKWSWWRSKRRKAAAPIIPDDRGLIYLPNFHENYVVAVTPLDHDLVYVAELNAPLRVANGILAGREVVLVLSEDGYLHVFSPTLMLQQTIKLSEAATDLVWADDLLWLVGEDRNHIDVLQVYEHAPGDFTFREYRALSGLSDLRHILYLPLAQTIAAVSSDTIHFIAIEDFSSESVPLPTTVLHAAAHDALLVFTEQGTGEALVLDLSSSAIMPLFKVDGKQLSDDPIIKEHQGFYEAWHGKFTVDLVSFQEPEDEEVRAYVQAIEQSNGVANTKQPEIIIHLQEQADFFRLPTHRDCVAGEHYESESFTLAGEETPLLVVTEGCSVILPADDTDPDSTESEVFAAWVTSETLRLKRQFNKTDGLHHRARISIYESVPELVTLDDLNSANMTGLDYQTVNGRARLALSNPVESNGFWIGSYESALFPVHEMTVLNSVEPDPSSLNPAGTSTTTEFRAQYRDSRTLTMQLSDWGEETPVIPSHGRLTALQVRLFMTTADLDKTPEVSGFDVDQIRHELLTVGFWDNHRQSAVNATTMPMLSSVYNDTSATGVYHSKMIDLTADTRMIPAPSLAPAAMQRQRYTLGNKINVSWQKSRYTMHRMTSQYKVGHNLFKAAPSQVTNWTQSTLSFLDRTIFGGIQRVSAANNNESNGIQFGQEISSVLLYARNAETQSLRASGRYSVTASVSNNIFRGTTRTSVSQETASVALYNNSMSIGDAMHYIGLRNFVARITNEIGAFTLHTHTIKLTDDALFGASYPSKNSAKQEASFIWDTTRSVVPLDALRPAPYHAPLNAVQSLNAVGLHTQRGVLGYDSNSYAMDRNNLVSTYNLFQGKVDAASSAIQSSWATASRSNAGESVLDVLTASASKAGNFVLSQYVTSWRERPPLFIPDKKLVASRDLWAAKADLDAWLAQPVSSNKALVADRISASEAQHLTMKMGLPLETHILSSNHSKQCKTIKLRAVKKTMVGTDGLAAYPAQTYTSKISLTYQYGRLTGLRTLAQDDVMSAFVAPSNKVSFAESIEYLMESGSRLQAVTHAIRFALDLVAMAPSERVPSDVTSSTISSLAQAITLGREIPMRATARTEFDVSSQNNTFYGKGLTPEFASFTAGLGRIDLESAGSPSTPKAEPIDFMYSGRHEALTDLVYSIVKGWSGETANEAQRFSKAILTSDGAQGMRPIVSKFNGALAEVVKSLASGGTVTTTQLVKFLTAAYMTSNLTSPVKAHIAKGTSISGIVQLLYRTLQSSEFTEDIKIGVDAKTTAINAVVLRMLRDGAVKEQKAIFARVSGNNTQGTAPVSISRYRWQVGLNGRLATMPSVKGLVHSVFGKRSKFAANSIASSGVTSAFSVLSSLDLSISETVRYRALSPDKVALSASRSTVVRPSLMSASRVAFALSKPTSLASDPMPAALGKTTISTESVKLTLSGEPTRLENRAEFVILRHTQGKLGPASFRVASSLGSSRDAEMLGAVSRVHTLQSNAKGWSFNQSANKDAWVNLISLQGAKPITQSSRSVIWSGYNPYSPTSFDSIGHTTSSVQSRLVALIKGIGTSRTADSGGLIKAKLLSKETTSSLVKAKSIGFLSPVITNTTADGLHYLKQDVRLTSDPLHSIDDIGISFNAKGWQTRLQSEMTKWAIESLKGLPQSALYTINKDLPHFAELVSYRFDKLGMTLGELVDTVKQKNQTSVSQGQAFTVANWTNVVGQSNYQVWQQHAKDQTIELTGAWGFMSHRAETVNLAKLDSIRYWIGRMGGRTTPTGSKFGQLVQTVAAVPTPAELVRSKYTTDTFKTVLQGNMHYEVHSAPTTSSRSIDYLKVTGYRTYQPKAIKFGLAQEVSFMNSVDLRKIAANSLRLGERIVAITDVLTRREVDVQLSAVKSLNVTEQAVMLQVALNSCMTQLVGSQVVDKQSLAGLPLVGLDVVSGDTEHTPAKVQFHIDNNHQVAMNDIFVKVGESVKHVMNMVDLLPHSGTRMALASVESVVMRWTQVVKDVFGINEETSTVTQAVALLKALPLNARTQSVDLLKALPLNARLLQPEAVVQRENKYSNIVGTAKETTNTLLADATLEVFGQHVTLADVNTKVIQPLVRLHEAFYKATTGLDARALGKLNGTFLSSFNPTKVNAIMTKQYPQALAEQAAYMSKQASDSYTLKGIEVITDALGRHTSLQLTSSVKETQHILLNKAYAANMASTSKQPVSVEFFITGSITIPGGRYSKTKDVTTVTTSSPWAYSQTMRLQSVGVTVNDYRVVLQNIGMSQTSSNITHVSDKARYWLPKINFNFPYGLPNWLQDYGYVGLQGMLPKTPYVQEKLNTSDATLDRGRSGSDTKTLYKSVPIKQLTSSESDVAIDKTRWLKRSTPDLWSADKPSWTENAINTSTVYLGTPILATFSSPMQTSVYADSNLSPSDASFVMDKALQDERVVAWVSVDKTIKYQPTASTAQARLIPMTGLPTVSPSIFFKRIRPITASQSSAIFERVLDSTIGSQATPLIQTSLSWSTYANEISKRYDSHVAPTRHNYALAIPKGVPIGMAARTDYVPISTVVSAEFRVTMRRSTIGFDLHTSRPIGEKAMTMPMPVRIDKLGRVNPQTVAHVANEISVVLRDAVNRVSDKLDYERLSAPSESQAYQRWVAELTGLAMQRWDYAQGKVSLSSKDHDAIVNIVRHDWFGEAWYDQQEASLNELTNSLVQEMNKTIKLEAGYRQSLVSDSQLLSVLVQAERVNHKVYSALVQAGLSHMQVDMILSQTQESVSAHYNRMKQYQLNALGQDYKFDQEDTGEQIVDGTYAQELTSDKALDGLYEQYELSMAKLYAKLKQMGLSDAQIQNAYVQARPDAESDLIVRSKYASYDNMVSAVGAAFEQYLLSDTAANMHYKMHRPMDAVEDAKYLGQTHTTPDVIDLYKQAELGNSDLLGLEYAVEMATILDSVDYSLMKPLPFHDRVDVNLPIKFRSEDFRRYKAGIVSIDLMQWLRDLRTEYREELIAKIHAGEAKGTYSPRAAMLEAIRNNIIEPILYRDAKDGSWLYRQFSPSDTQYNYILWGSL